MGASSSEASTAASSSGARSSVPSSSAARTLLAELEELERVAAQVEGEELPARPHHLRVRALDAVGGQVPLVELEQVREIELRDALGLGVEDRLDVIVLVLGAEDERPC